MVMTLMIFSPQSQEEGASQDSGQAVDSTLQVLEEDEEIKIHLAVGAWEVVVGSTVD